MMASRLPFAFSRHAIRPVNSNKRFFSSHEAYRSLFVTNLRPTNDWVQLKDFYKQAGPVEYVHIGNNKTTAAVRFETEAAVFQAIDTLTHYRGQRLIHHRDDPQWHKDHRCNVLIGPIFLDTDVRWMEMKDLLKPFGRVTRVNVYVLPCVSSSTTTERGAPLYGTARFDKASEAEAARNALQGTEWMGQKLFFYGTMQELLASMLNKSSHEE